MKRFLALLALLIRAAPAAAAPRLTLRLENVTLHETLRQLQAFYGTPIRGTGGEGAADYAERPGAPRSSFQWERAGIGVVLRDVARQFGLRAETHPDGSIALEPRTVAPQGLTLNREGLVISLRRVRQSESRSQSAPAAPVEVKRSVELSLEIHPQEGDPDLLYALENLRARDEAGRDLPAAPPVRRIAGFQPGGFPDEWSVAASFGGFHPAARLLSSIEGEVVLYREAATHRVEVPVGEVRPGGEWTAGPARLRAPELSAAEGRPGRFFLAWPREVEIQGGSEGSSAGVSLFARLGDGRLARVPISFGGLSVDEKGEHSALFTLRAPLPEGVTGWAWDITAHARPERRVPFRFVQVPLPLAEPSAAALARPGILLSLPAGGQRAGELTIGYSRQQSKGWGPVRWTTLEADERGEALLDGVTPGVYRLQVSFRPRDGRGNLAPSVPLRTPAPACSVPASRAVRVDLLRR